VKGKRSEAHTGAVRCNCETKRSRKESEGEIMEKDTILHLCKGNAQKELHISTVCLICGESHSKHIDFYDVYWPDSPMIVKCSKCNSEYEIAIKKRRGVEVDMIESESCPLKDLSEKDIKTLKFLIEKDQKG